LQLELNDGCLLVFEFLLGRPLRKLSLAPFIIFVGLPENADAPTSPTKGVEQTNMKLVHSAAAQLTSQPYLLHGRRLHETVDVTHKDGQG
jgi:hypothetical protein